MPDATEARRNLTNDAPGAATWAFLDGLTDGVYVVDLHGLCTRVNPAALAMLGYASASDLLGRNMHDVIHHTRPDGSHFPVAACPLLHTLSSGRAVKLDRELLWRQDGTSFVAEYSSYPLVGENGQITGSVITFVSTSPLMKAAPPAERIWGDAERRRAEDALRESEARFRTLADSIPQLAWTADPDGAISWFNRRWYDYTGTTPADMQGWGWTKVHHPEHVERVTHRIREAFAAGTDWEDTFPLKGKDGHYRWFLSRALPIRDVPDGAAHDGRILGWFGTNTDVTELREAEQRLSDAKDAAEAANRAKSAFLANMSHELRTPLSAVIGYSEMLEEDAEGIGATAMTADLAKIKSNAKHLLSLINDVLDLSKIEADKMETSAEEFAVEEFTRESATTVEALIARKQNRLVLDLSPDLGTMHSDATKLRQCLLNLLGNASKFTDKGQITLRVRRENAEDGAWVTFAVADTGIGMTPAQLGQLFQRFTQADETTTRRFGGTGLGLALSRAFSRLLGGDITVTSTEGEGTCFTLRVPAILPQRAPDVDEAPHRTQTDDGLPRDLVLVIDDDASQRDLLTRFLERQNFAVQTAPDGRQGLDLARALHPRVILLDVMMPELDGWSVLNALKADPITADIPVVMVSFVAEAGLSAALGAADSIPKPVDWVQLKSVMDKFREAGGDVLVVDDDPDIRRQLRLMLERGGWSVQEAENGAEALDRVLHTPPHLIVLDLSMPVMDGFDFLHRLRETPGFATLPVVVLTARDISATERERLANADRVFRKGETSFRQLTAELRTLNKHRTVTSDS